VATPDWHTLADIGGFVGVIGTFIGFGMKQAKARGVQDQRMADVQEVVIDHGKKLTDHESRLSDGAGNFKVIDAKLDNIAKAQEETNRLLINHITRQSRD
jgi:hypothetical protein